MKFTKPLDSILNTEAKTRILRFLCKTGAEWNGSQIGVFEGRFFKSTVLICLSFFMLMQTFYFLLNWIPKNMVDLGFTVQNGIFASVLINLGGIAGGFAFGYVADRIGARIIAPFIFVALFLSILVLASLNGGLELLFAASFVFGFFIQW